MSKINLQRGILTVDNRRSREKKTDMLRRIGKQSGESVGKGGRASRGMGLCTQRVCRGQSPR